MEHDIITKRNDMNHVAVLLKFGIDCAIVGIQEVRKSLIERLMLGISVFLSAEFVCCFPDNNNNNNNNNNETNHVLRDMVCLRNICVNTLHKGDSIFTTTTTTIIIIIIIIKYKLSHGTKRHRSRNVYR
jgi:hypothetical protein